MRLTQERKASKGAKWASDLFQKQPVADEVTVETDDQ